MFKAFDDFRLSDGYAECEITDHLGHVVDVLVLYAV